MASSPQVDGIGCTASTSRSVAHHQRPHRRQIGERPVPQVDSAVAASVANSTVGAVDTAPSSSILSIRSSAPPRVDLRVHRDQDLPDPARVRAP